MKNVPFSALFNEKDESDLQSQTVFLLGRAVEYKDLMMMYTCAIKEIQTKFDILNMEFSARNSRNPISSISSRLKSTPSILEKLRRKGLGYDLQTVRDNIKDVAGIRVICSYIDDISHRKCTDTAGRYHSDRAKGLYKRAEAQRIQKSASDSAGACVFLPKQGQYDRRGADTHDRHGFLGESGASTQI